MYGRLCAFLMTVGLIIIASPAASFEDRACSTWATVDNPRTERAYRSRLRMTHEITMFGPRLDELMYYWNKGVLFHLPYGYMNPWQITERTTTRTLEEHLEAISRNSARTGYDASTGRFNPDLLGPGVMENDIGSPEFSFWMPSGRYIERNMRWTPTMRPCEPGREPPEDGQYVVRFRILWPGSPNVEQSPQIQYFENARRSPTSNPTIFHSFDDDFFVRLRCPGSICDGWIWDRDRDYILFIVFPEFLRQENPEFFWRAPTNTAIQFLESWRSNTEDTDND